MSSAEHPAHPGQPTPTDPESGETVIDEETTQVHRAPRYFNFLILGGIIGAIAAFILTVAFPDNPDFGKTQVFGFLLLACGTFGVAIGGAVALILDRFGGRSRTVVVDRLAGHDSPADPAPDADSSSHSSNETTE